MEVRRPKKLALYVAFSLAACEYATLARHVGLHKDTVHSHCGEIREGTLFDPELEKLVGALGSAAIVHMEISGIALNAPRSSQIARVGMRQRVRDLQRGMNDLCEALSESLSDDTLRTSDPFAVHPTGLQKKLRVAA